MNPSHLSVSSSPVRMNVQTERRLASHVKALGEQASAEVFPELAEATRSPSALVRRLAASALGKLAGVTDSVASVDLLCLILITGSACSIRRNSISRRENG